jgi:hypothetical protein
LAVSDGAIATPLELVIAVAVAPVLNTPLAPLAGAANVTVAPMTGFPPLVTVTCSAVVNAVFTVVLCGVPAVVLTVPLPPPPCNAAPFNVTFPLPEVIVQVTVNVCPAPPAWYASV